MSDEGFLDFGMGVGDDNIGKRAKNFKVKDGVAYRISFCWFSVLKEGADGQKFWDDDAAWDKEGNLVADAQVRFAGCRRIYLKGVGNILYKSNTYAQFGKPKDAIGTILCVWPTDDEGDLDAAKFKAGKGWQVQPWVHGDGEKYQALKKIHKRRALTEHDVLFSCPENGGEFQKITFTAENENLLVRLLQSDKPEMRAVADKIIAEARAMAKTMKDEMARDLTIDEIKEKLTGSSDTPTGTTNHASKDVDELLDDVL